MDLLVASGQCLATLFPNPNWLSLREADPNTNVDLGLTNAPNTKLCKVMAVFPVERIWVTPNMATLSLLKGGLDPH